MGVTKIGHAGLKVKDMELSLRFYCEGLGMKKKFTLYKDEKDSLPWIEYLEFGDQQFVELFYSYESRKDHPVLKEYYTLYHIALIVEDIHEMEIHLREMEIIPPNKPILGPDGTWQMWVTDPDGNEIELMQYTEDSLQTKM